MFHKATSLSEYADNKGVVTYYGEEGGYKIGGLAGGGGGASEVLPLQGGGQKF